MGQVIVYDDKIRMFLVRTPKIFTILLVVFGPGPVVQNQREQQRGSEAILRRVGVADGGLKGAPGAAMWPTGGSGGGGCSR